MTKEECKASKTGHVRGDGLYKPNNAAPNVLFFLCKNCNTPFREVMVQEEAEHPGDAEVIVVHKHVRADGSAELQS